MMITMLAFIGAIALLVVFHEFGHYWVARRCGVKVLRFSLGFGNVIYSKRFADSDTEWVISSVPLGGYVKMVDEREEAGCARRSALCIQPQAGVAAHGDRCGRPAGEFSAGDHVVLGLVHSRRAGDETDAWRCPCPTRLPRSARLHDRGDDTRHERQAGPELAGIALELLELALQGEAKKTDKHEAQTPAVQPGPHAAN